MVDLMSRIISGFADNLTLVVPKVGTRPTSDRVREALFSSLDARDEIRGRRVLDLYAGTGASVSRPHRATRPRSPWSRRPRRRRRCCGGTSTPCSHGPRSPARHTPRVDIVTQTVRSYLTGSGALVDLVFFDPPYELSKDELADDLTALLPLLDAQALVVVERASRDGEPSWPAGLTLDVKKQFGDTTVWFALRD